MGRTISVLSEAACEAIADKVKLRKGADRKRLLEDIQAAASWYVFRAELRPEKAQKVRATLHDLLDKLEAARDALERFPAELRVLLHEAAEPDHHGIDAVDWQSPTAAEDAEFAAWRSPTAAAEAELSRLVPLVRKAVARIPVVKRGPKYGRLWPEGMKVLLTAWETATGRSPFSDVDAFLDFARALRTELNKANYHIAKKPTLQQMKAAKKLIR